MKTSLIGDQHLGDNFRFLATLSAKVSTCVMQAIELPARYSASDLARKAIERSDRTVVVSTLSPHFCEPWKLLSGKLVTTKWQAHFTDTGVHALFFLRLILCGDSLPIRHAIIQGDYNALTIWNASYIIFCEKRNNLKNKGYDISRNVKYRYIEPIR